MGEEPINFKLGNCAEVKSVYTQSNALTCENCTTAVHRGSFAFMVLELIIEELSIASAGADELKTVVLQKFAKKNLICAKIKKDLASTHSLKPFLLIIQDPNEIKKFRAPFCRHC